MRPMPPPPPQRQERPFRRRRFAAPHRRPGLFRLLVWPFLTALFAVAVPAAAAHWVLTSPTFHLRHLEVEGTDRVPADWVLEELEPLRGRHLLRLSLAEVETRVERHPWVEGAMVRKRLPDILEVGVVERRPAALLRRDDGLDYVDIDGRTIDRYDPEGPVDLVLLTVRTGASLQVGQALAVAAGLAGADREWGAGLSEIEILSESDFRLHTAALPFPLLVTGGRVEEGLGNLHRFLPEILRRYERVAAVDVRFTRQIVIQPAGDPRNQKG